MDQIFESIVRYYSEERARNVLVKTRNELFVEARDEIFEVLFVKAENSDNILNV